MQKKHMCYRCQYLIKLCVIVALCLCALSLTTFAESTDLRVIAERRHDNNAGTVMLNNHVVVRFYGDVNTLGPERRAKNFVAKLTQLAAMGVESDNPNFFAGIEGDKTVIKFKDMTICQVTELETIINKTNDVLLAKEWLAKIRDYLAKMPKDSQFVQEDTSLPNKGLAEVFKPLIKSRDYIVAHRTLPIGEIVRIVNLKNKWSLIAQVAERGVPSKKAMIGLAPNTAEALGIDSGKLVMVRLEKGL